MSTNNKKMSADQLRHAQYRLQQFYNERRVALLKKHTTENKVVTVGELAIMIKNGVVKPRRDISKDSKVGENWRIANMYDLSALPLQPTTVDCKAYEAEKVVLDEERDRVLDQLMLGDMSEALALITSFRRGSYGDRIEFR